MIDEFACVFGFVGLYICMTPLKRRNIMSEMSTTADGRREDGTHGRKHLWRSVALWPITSQHSTARQVLVQLG